MNIKLFAKLIILSMISIAFIYSEIKVSFVGGVGYVKRGDTKVKLAKGDLINSDDIIITEKRSLVILKNSDGTVFKLLPNSIVQADFHTNTKEKTSGEPKLLKEKLSYLVNSLFKNSASEVKIIEQNRVTSIRG